MRNRQRFIFPHLSPNLLTISMPGVLALSFACQQGGSILFCLGLPAIALWNVYAVHRLVLCLALISDKKTSGLPSHQATSDSPLQSSRQRRQNANQPAPLLSPSKQHLTESLLEKPTQQQPPEGISTMGQVAWHAFGHVGLQLLDASMLFLLLGIIVAYVAGSITFLGDTPFTMGTVMDGLACAFFMALISLVPHVGHLSWVSATGLLVLLGTFCVIAGYGIKDRLQQDADNSLPLSAIPLLPASISGVSHLFGIAVFSYGVAPLTYNFQSSMQHPQKMVPATCIALSLTSISYIILGVGMLLFYPNLTGDLLHELPAKGMLPVMTRLAMVWVCIMTAPLLIIPCSELVEGKWQIQKRAALRFGICLSAVFIAIAMPSFVQVLALVGCACVGLVGFCLPPLFHLKLSAASREYVSHQTSTWVLDTVMLTWGVAVTVLSTYYTFQRVRHE
jgi:amino acid permease